MTVLQVCAYGAPYPGNFIASLETLEKALADRGIQTIYAFVGRAANAQWCKQIQKRTKVYFLPEAKARILPQTYQAFRKIYKETSVDIVHSHFELYDIPATVTAPSSTKIFWHLHDPLKHHKGLRGLLWKVQYGVVGKRATLLSVAEKYRDFVVSLGFPKEQTHLLLNSIQLERIRPHQSSNQPCFRFLTFGWDFTRKGDDVILAACDRLEAEGYDFRFLLNGNHQTWPQLDAHLQGRKPVYLETGDPVDDINELFDISDVFIQASRSETFSYSVCEAAYSGLPVISSDIPGLEWAHTIPTIDLFESENVYQLYLLMKKFLDGAVVSPQDISTSRHIIEQHYSLQVWVNNVIQHYGL
jgi:glycosyltransferase involved in cell wall biosynthesis